MAPRDVPALLSSAAAERPDVVALVDPDDRRLTYAQLEEEVTRVASGLVAGDIVAGTRVLLACSNRLELVTSYLGVLRAQAVAVPVNPQATAQELALMVADTGALVVVADADALATVREGVALVRAALAGEPTRLDAGPLSRAVVPRVVAVGTDPGPGETSYAALRAGVGGLLPPLLDPERPAVLSYPGGAVGARRAAVLSHRALVANIEQVAGLDPPLLREGDVVLGVLPLYHVFGLNAVLGGVLRHRATLVVVPQLPADTTLDLVARLGCTVVPAVSQVFEDWLALPRLRERLAGVRLLLSGSTPLDRETGDRVVEATGVPLHQAYGLTEAGPVVTITLRSQAPGTSSLGAPLDGGEVRLRDDRGNSVEAGDPGQVEIRGPHLFSGYWPDGTDGPGADGWWPTGDVGFLDGAGDLHLVDRLHELVVVSGFHVFPQEVEDVIAEVPGVAAAAVIGVEHPRTGQAVVAYVATDGTDPASVTEAVLGHCADRLAGFKRPTRVEVVDALPRTLTGRVQKSRLRALERIRTPEPDR